MKTTTTTGILKRLDRFSEVHDGEYQEMAAEHWETDVRHLLAATLNERLRVSYWRAKDDVRRAGDAYVRTSKAAREARAQRLERAKGRVKTLRAQLRAAGVKP